MLDYRQLNILTDLVQEYYNEDENEKDLILSNLEILKCDVILQTINKYTK